MSTILTIASQKGGVGKTTTAVNLAYSLALAGKEVLLFDLDPQGNGSSGVGFPGSARSAGDDVGGCLSLAVRNRSLESCVRKTSFDHLSLLPASAELARLELIQEVQGKGLESWRRQVRKVGEAYDLVLVDCPPSLGGLPTLALSASDQVIIPVQCEYYAMEGLSQILPVIQELNQQKNHDLSIGGLLLTMFADELDLSHDVVREISEYFANAGDDVVFRTIIPRDVVLAEAASHGLPAFAYAPLSRGAWSYLELAREVLAHGGS